MSLRLLLLLMICAALAILWEVPDEQPRVVRTDRMLDLSIVGDDYFCLCDQETGDSRFTQSGHFIVNSVGQLCLRQGGQEFTIDPPIVIPENANRIYVSLEGEVSVVEEYALYAIGSIRLASFISSPPFDDPLAINEVGEGTSAPYIYNANAGKSVIQQGWLQEHPKQFRPLAFRVLCAVVVAIVLNQLWHTRKSGTTPVRNSSSSTRGTAPVIGDSPE